jgi:hypothetical protein
MDFIANLRRLGYEGKVSAIRQTHEQGIGNAGTKVIETAIGDQNIPVAGQDESGDPNAAEAGPHVEVLGQAKTVSHHALIGLPALSRDELEQRILMLRSAEEDVEKLIDERAVRWKRKARQDSSGHALEQATLKTGADSLNNQVSQSMGKAGRKIQPKDSPKRNAHDGGFFKAEKIDQFGQIVGKIGQFKWSAQGETVPFSPELITDDAEMPGQNCGKWPQKAKTSR